MAAVIVKGLQGVVADLIAADLNTLANNAYILSTVVFDNTAGNTPDSTHGDGYTRGILELVLGGVLGSNPAANSGITFWFIKSIDGTNYEAGTAAVPPIRPADGVLLFQPASTAAADQRTTKAIVDLPPCKFKLLAKNDGSGVSLPSSGNKVRLLPITDEGV